MSCGPGDASGWPWKQNAGRSVRARPCSVPSNRLTCVAPQIGRQRLLVDREAVVLAGDAHATGVQVLHRMIRAVVAELHLEGLRPAGQRHDLVPQADAEGRIAGFHQLARGGDRVIAGLRVAGSVREEHAIGLELPDLRGRRLRRHHRHTAAALGQHPQDVLLHAVVIRHHVIAAVRSAPRSRNPGAIRSGSTHTARAPKPPWPDRGPPCRARSAQRQQPVRSAPA